MRLSIVIPVHQEAEAIPMLLRRLDQTLKTLDCNPEVLFVDDGSTDGTWPLLLEAAAADGRVRAVRLSRNFGHQVALTAGLLAAEGDALITMDGDLQHPPETIPDLLAKAGEGFDVVYAIRSSEDVEGWFKVTSARAFYWLLGKLTSLDLPQGGADFRYMSRRVVEGVLAMPERHRFLRGMTRWVGYSQTVIEYRRAAREGGRSKYTLRRMVSLGLEGVLSFSAIPLRIASVLGFIASALGALYLVYVVAVRVFTDRSVQGWTSVVVVALLLGGAQLSCLGIIGQYLGRMFDEVKRRPLFFIADDTAEPALRERELQDRVAALPTWPDSSSS